MNHFAKFTHLGWWSSPVASSSIISRDNTDFYQALACLQPNYRPAVPEPNRTARKSNSTDSQALAAA